MAEQWDATTVHDWLQPAFELLVQRWEQEPDLEWSQLRTEFLETLSLSNESDVVVVQRLFEWLDEQPADEQRRFLTAVEERDEFVWTLITDWQAEAGAAGESEQAGEHEHAGEDEPAEDEWHDPATVTARVVDEMGARAMAELLQQRPELAGQVSPDELRLLLGEVLAEKLTTA